jgi:hypothetical protein
MLIEYEVKSPNGCNNEKLKATGMWGIKLMVERLIIDRSFCYGDRITTIDVLTGGAIYRLDADLNSNLTLTLINKTKSTKWFTKELKRIIRIINKHLDGYELIKVTIIN